ncbi:MAG: beta-L-arabinofuranosidase domain-containing protein, partial [Dysgonamonadaceae bacterium]
MKNFVLLMGIALCVFPLTAQTRQQVDLFSLNQVRLLESPFLSAQQTDLRYLLALEPDRLLSPFLREAGLQPKAPSYPNWENTGLDGHIGGH